MALALNLDEARSLLSDDFNSYERCLALRASVQLDLFTKIAAGYNRSRALARELGCAEKGIRVLCDYLALAGYVYKARNCYSLPLHSRIYLVRSSPGYIGSALPFLASDQTLNAFTRLLDAVRNGACSRKSDLRASARYWVAFATGMAPLARRAAEIVAEELARQNHGGIRILDVAAGHGWYGCELALRNPAAEIVALDGRAVLKVALQNARSCGVEDRYRVLPGDALKVRFGEPYNLVLIANLVHHLAPAQLLPLFRKARQALKPGGLCVIVDTVPTSMSEVCGAESFALLLFATSRTSRIYALSEYTTRLQAAGFKSTKRLKRDVFGSSILVASV